MKINSQKFEENKNVRKIRKGKYWIEYFVVDTKNNKVNHEFERYCTEKILFNKKRKIEVVSYYDKDGNLVWPGFLDSSVYYTFFKKDKNGRVILEAYFDQNENLTKNSLNKASVVNYFYKKNQKSPFLMIIYNNSQVIGGYLYKNKNKNPEIISEKDVTKYISSKKILKEIPQTLHEFLVVF